MIRHGVAQVLRYATTMKRRPSLATIRHHRQSAKEAPKPRRSSQPWVPPAYRGVSASNSRARWDDSSGKSKGRSKRNHRSRSQTATRKGKQKKSSNQLRKEKESQAEKEKKEKRKMFNKNCDDFVSLYETLELQMTDYHRALSSSETRDLSDLMSRFDGSLKHSEKRKAATVSDKFQKIFDTYQPVDDIELSWEEIEKLDVTFRSMMRTLHDTSRTSLSICHVSESNALTRYLSIACNSVNLMKKLHNDRIVLIRKAAMRKERETAERKLSSPLTDLVSILFGGLLGSKSANQIQEKDLRHDDAGSMWLVLDAVVNEICDFATDDIEKTPEAKEKARFAAGRLVELLRDAPPYSSHFSPLDAGVRLLELLTFAGDLESCRVGYAFFQEGTNSDVFRFSLVLRIYVEAVCETDDKEEKKTIARECFEAATEQWKKLQIPEAERLLQCGLVLRCFAQAEIGNDPNGIQMTKEMMKSSLGTEGYDRILNPIASGASSVDAQVLPMLNYLVHVLSDSNDDSKTDEAAEILRFLCRASRTGLSGSIVYPNIETVNSMLRSYVKKIENHMVESTDEANTIVGQATYFVNQMFTREEPGCLPDQRTFEYMFRMIHGLSLEGTCSRAQKLLTKMDLRQALSKGNDFNPPLSLYHRALGCFLLAAKSGGSERACEHAARLVDRLELQSRPLILTEERLASANVKGLYYLALRPTSRTYKLLLSICSETANEEEKQIAADIAYSTLLRVKEEEMVDDEAYRDLVEMCQSTLCLGEDTHEDIRELFANDTRKTILVDGKEE